MKPNILHHLKGVIANAGFASGDRFVIGMWNSGPIGAMNDVMWARPDGRRTLIAASEEIAAYVNSVYVFDETLIEPLVVGAHGKQLSISSNSMELVLTLGKWKPLPPLALRPRWVNRYVEGPIARAVYGVNIYGVSPVGVREWYRASAVTRIISATAKVGGQSCGELLSVWQPCKFGFSEPPNKPMAVRVSPVLEFPSLS